MKRRGRYEERLQVDLAVFEILSRGQREIRFCRIGERRERDVLCAY